ncbi:hypothetical protein AB0K48_51455, partial [Nonomuraea sp. NPDC055795]
GRRLPGAGLLALARRWLPKVHGATLAPGRAAAVLLPGLLAVPVSISGTAVAFVTGTALPPWQVLLWANAVICTVAAVGIPTMLRRK